MDLRLALADDLGTATWLFVGCVAVLWGALAAHDIARHRGPRALLALSAVLSVTLLLAALLRPVRVKSQSNYVGARVVVLVDRGRRMLLPDAASTREARLTEVVKNLGKTFQKARVSWLGFGAGEPQPFAPKNPQTPRQDESDLSTALLQLSRASGERAQAVVVVSDGRFVRPGAAASDAELERILKPLNAPVHAVNVASRTPRDAAVREVHHAGAAVAHQPLSLRVDIACSGGLVCGEVPVTVRELRQGAAPALLAEGKADLTGKELTTVEFQITLERAGTRLVEVALAAPSGDEVPDNDRRILTFGVARERVRLLHVAGRPTYDVRSLRMWLKSNESVDLVAFFILRTLQSTPMTQVDTEELALIPFPVDELFTDHLPSFDAVVLQDIDAIPYGLFKHLPALERYVRTGGGLIMVGGPSSFAGGGYAGSPLERALPAGLGDPNHPFDLAEFVPRYTESGRAAPVLGPLRDLVGDDLPKMFGSNTLGRARDGALVLWEQPARRAGEAALPVLALADSGDGRAISLAVDGTHQLGFSEFAERTAGRAYGALWDGLLGWLMRDPRYEAARVELASPCTSPEPPVLRLTPLPGTTGDAELEVEPLGGSGSKVTRKAALPASSVLELSPGPLEPGGYTARVRVGRAPATRFDFACERGGPAFSDSRPDAPRLERIAKLSGGRYVDAAQVSALPVPEPTEVAAQREVAPVLPQWSWALLAAAAFGWHWIERRRAGLA